ncbi:RNA ligase family protein [Streptomyces abyssomicinicus]|uniref:RNA ligase family protein n=1 Tax=Streptomyces abyssomicinicus TaxID=574929 RepID=UPI001FEBD957|nr:RNA ligase family protein [Streptomyces abyssomicinicus]
MTAPDLAALNSATKYPSIPTYHRLDPKNGNLLEEQTRFTGDVLLTEKVDGTNGRIVLLPDGDYFIGSREELLHARGDRVHNPALGIVDELKPLADRLEPRDARGRVTVFFLEVYGRKIGGAAKQYTGGNGVGHRLFDVAFLQPDVLERSLEQISSWRDAGGQDFGDEATLQEVAATNGIPLVPRLTTLPGDELPASVDGMATFLAERLPATRVALDDGAGGTPEGIVLRTPDRSVIAKARFQDYARTLKRRARR